MIKTILAFLLLAPAIGIGIGAARASTDLEKWQLTMSTEPRCVKWSWTGDVYNRTVTCVEWARPAAKDKQTKKNV